MSDTVPFHAAVTTPQGFVRSVSPIDGVHRLLSFRSVVGYPLIVVAGFDEAEFLAESLALRSRYFAAAGAATVMLLIWGCWWPGRRACRTWRASPPNTPTA